jgi:hypothetical protein
MDEQETREEYGLLKFRVRLGDGMKIRAVTFIPNGQTGDADGQVTTLMTACDQGFLYQWKYCHPKTGGPCCTAKTAVDAGKGVFELLKVFHSGKNTAPLTSVPKINLKLTTHTHHHDREPWVC